jgi:hypothetical protein
MPSTLTADQLAVLRVWVGDKVTDSDLQARYARLGTLTATAEEILRSQLKKLIDAPSSLSLPSGLSISRSANITALQQTLKELLSIGSIDGDRGQVAVYPMYRPDRR